MNLMQTRSVIRAIPTFYKGRQFRSRLEARWAAFFDLLEWHWEYEPFDCDGWIPDFLLMGRRETLVEVKPITVFDEAVAAEMDRSGATHKFELLLVGCTVPPVAKTLNGFGEVFGWTRETMGEGHPWGDAVFGRWAGQARVGWCHADGYFMDRISGQYDGGSWGGSNYRPAETNHAWQIAGNSVQWRKRA